MNMEKGIIVNMYMSLFDDLEFVVVVKFGGKVDGELDSDGAPDGNVDGVLDGKIGRVLDFEDKGRHCSKLLRS